MYPASTRHITTIGITASAFALAIGTAVPAFADPGNGNGSGAGNGNAPSEPPGQAKQNPSPTAPPTQTAAPAPTPTATHVPPGQVKRTPAPPKINGNSNAGGNGKGKAKGAAKGNSGGGGNGNGNGKGANGPSGHNPPGNNGTVKIHAIPGDPGHHNVAHPGCAFVVDFWGFDAGQTLNVSFTGQAPTGAGTPLSLSGSGTTVTSPDDAGGGNDPDGELVFTPTASELSALGAPAKQGYHVRLTVATGQGGGQKQKVFWIGPCAVDTSVTSTPTPTDTPELSTDTPTITSDTATAVANVPVPSVPQLDTARVSRTTPRLFEASPPVTSLPFTGANLGTLIAVGGLATIGGAVLLVAARRRRGGI